MLVDPEGNSDVITYMTLGYVVLSALFPCQTLMQMIQQGLLPCLDPLEPQLGQAGTPLETFRPLMFNLENA
jgi:hypothetical protein